MFLSRLAQLPEDSLFLPVDDFQQTDESVDELQLVRSLPQAAPVYKPIFRALYGLTWNWFTLYFVCAGAGGGAVSAAFSYLVSLPPEPDCQDLQQDAPTQDSVTCIQRAIAMGATPEAAQESSESPRQPLFSEQRPPVLRDLAVAADHGEGKDASVANLDKTPSLQFSHSDVQPLLQKNPLTPARQSSALATTGKAQYPGVLSASQIQPENPWRGDKLASGYGQQKTSPSGQFQASEGSVRLPSPAI